MELLNREKSAVLITELGARAATVQADIHLVGCSALAHMRDHGDYRTALQLMNALPNGPRVQGLAVWFREFSSGKFSLNFDSKEKTWKGSLKKDRTEADFRVDDAIEVSFADFTKERTPKQFDVMALVRFIKSKADNTETNPDGTFKVSPAAREAASRLLKLAADNGLVPNV